MTAGVLLLAAGRARRFGSDKRFATLPDGRTVLGATLDAIESSGLPLLVCLRPGDEAAIELLNTRGLKFVECDRTEEGMGAVLAQGITVIPDWNGVLIALADMPWVQANTYQAIAEGLADELIHRPDYKGKQGNPVGFGAAWYKALAALSGDQGARGILREHSGQVTHVCVDDPGVLEDIDTPDSIHGAD